MGFLIRRFKVNMAMERKGKRILALHKSKNSSAARLANS